MSQEQIEIYKEKIENRQQQLEINAVEIENGKYKLAKLEERQLEIECILNGYEDHLKQLQGE